MRPHVADLHAFYESRLGQLAQRMIRGRLREIWPDLSAMSLLGLGYATPYLRPFRDEAERVIAAMPAGQGVMRWPEEGRNLAGLVDEVDLPFPDLTFDRVLMVHAIENSEEIRPLLREAWRVLASGGRLLLVVPNRRGIWARFERTPFGHGHPFAPRQLAVLLRDCLFTQVRSASALYLPPSDTRLILRFGAAWEEIGIRLGLGISGVLVVEAIKEVYSVTPSAALKRSRRRLPGLALPSGASRNSFTFKRHQG
jgi:SAM-dependent methyltransferase